MITVNIDDSTPTGKRLINELKKHKKTVHFQETIKEDIPEGSLSHDEFFSLLKKKVKQYYEEI